MAYSNGYRSPEGAVSFLASIYLTLKTVQHFAIDPASLWILPILFAYAGLVWIFIILISNVVAWVLTRWLK